MNSPLLTKKDVARRLKTSTRTVDRLRRMGDLPSHAFPGTGLGRRPLVRFEEKDVEEYVAKYRKDIRNKV